MVEQTNAISEREKWQADLDLRKEELALKRRELDVRENESARGRWTNPLVLAVAGAALAAVGNIVATFYTGVQQRALEGIKNTAEVQREHENAESQLILEVIKTANPDKAAENLQFLVDTSLISNSQRRDAIKNYVTSRAAGTGVVLPASNTSSIDPLQLFPEGSCTIFDKQNVYEVSQSLVALLRSESYSVISPPERDQPGALMLISLPDAQAILGKRQLYFSFDAFVINNNVVVRFIYRYDTNGMDGKSLSDINYFLKDHSTQLASRLTEQLSKALNAKAVCGPTRRP